MKYETGIETRKRILEISTEQFLEKGFHETSIREIAGILGVSSGTLYKHFKNKEAILETILQPYLDRWEQVAEKQMNFFAGQLKQAKGDKEAIVRLMDNNTDEIYLNLVEENLPIWTFIFFRSQNTRYEGFLDRLTQWSLMYTLKLLDMVYPNKEYLENISEKQLHYIIQSQVTSVFNTFKLDLDLEERRELIESVMHVYKLFWEELFSNGFRRKR